MLIRTYIHIIIILLFIFTEEQSISQPKPVYKTFTSIPDKEGMAGMYAGVSLGKVFCMGGANFPDTKPWEGGKKTWYDKIFMLTAENEWKTLEQRLPHPMAYGVSVEYKQEIILVGGNNANSFHQEVYGMQWKNNSIHFTSYPSLPIPMANMAGAIIGDLIFIAGGTSSSTGEPLKKMIGLDLKDLSRGWFELPVWPGPSVTQAVAGAVKNTFYLFSGETIGMDQDGKIYRKILTDAYAFSPMKKNGAWTGTWMKLKEMPHGASASGNQVPVFQHQYMFLWGGLDSATAQIKNPTTHPGFPKTMLMYNIEQNEWKELPHNETLMSPVTLPVVHWKNSWLYISGEVRPGIRTNQVIQLSIQHP